MIPRFAFPDALYLLAIVAWSLWLGCRIRSLSSGRKWIAVVLRGIILLCLVGALAGAELVKTTDKLAVFFLLDRSNSIPEEARMMAEQAVRNYCDQYMKERDEAGVIVFGDDASIEIGVAARPKLEGVKSYVGGEQTDLAAAIRLAMAAFPQGAMKRIVLFSDGNETRESVLEEIKLARAAGIEVDVFPLTIGGKAEVQLREVAAPSQVNTNEPYRLRMVVRSEQDCEAVLRLTERGKQGSRALPPQNVRLQKGDNSFLLSQTLKQPGFYEYEASIESTADSVLANNEGRTFSFVRGEPTVLYVETDPQNSLYLEPALKAEGVRVERIAPGDLPTSLAQLQNYDALILSNVSATDLTSDLMKTLEAAVRDLGIGLVMIGGPDSFGAGGYLDTPIEKILPVTMDLKQRKVMPRGALALIMHTCEIQDGNAWAREIGLASLNVLSSQDLMGALAYKYTAGEGWLYEIQPVGNKNMMRDVLYRDSSNIGDMPSVSGTLEMAYLALEKADAAVKRIVIISDGDPAGPSQSLLQKIVDAKISVSTVCIAPHSPNDQSMLRWVAETTGGQYYYVTNPSNLPQIFTKEAAAVKRGMLIEHPFQPIPQHESEILLGSRAEELPPLDGYVATSPKEGATIALISDEQDPILAHWRYGLGKSVAFTSDVTTRWAGDWVAWGGFNRFWAQAVRWAMRESKPSNFRVETSVQNGKGTIRIDAVNSEGKYVNFLHPIGIVTGPAPAFVRQDLSLEQTSPGIYEDSFPLDKPGVYMINLTYETEDGTQGSIQTGLALNYSREYEYNTTNVSLLEQVASQGAGNVYSPNQNPFEHNLVLTPTITPIWPILATTAVCLFPIEIFVRRVMVNFSFLWLWIFKLLRLVPTLRRFISLPTLSPAPVTGRYLAASKEYRFEKDANAEPTSFGIEVKQSPTETATSSAETPQEKEITKEPKDGQTDYTQQLLAAKKRAMEKKRTKGT